LLVEGLENVSQSGWLGAPTTLSHFLLEELRIVQINNYRGSWMKRMSKYFLVSKTILVRDLFFQTFYKNNLRFFKIIKPYYLQLSKLIKFCYHKVPNTLSCVILCESNISRIDKCWSQLDDHPYNLSIWTYECKIYLVWFQDMKGSFWNLLCSTKQNVCSVQPCSTFDTSWSLKTAHKDSIFQFLAVFAFRDFWVHISSMYSCYIITDIEIAIDKVLSFCATLDILYFNDDCYVRLR